MLTSGFTVDRKSGLLNESRRSSKTHSPLFFFFLFLCLSLTDRGGRGMTVHTGCGLGGKGVNICYKSREIQENCESSGVAGSQQEK